MAGGTATATTAASMATEENDGTYDGRKPTFDSRGRVRGFRSKPGAPMADPTNNIGDVGIIQKRDGRGFTSNWDEIFRNTASNKFGQTVNPNYFSQLSPPTAGASGPSGAEDPEDLQSAGFVPGMPSNYQPPANFSGTAPSHAQVWSAPPPRRADDSMPGAPYMPKGPDWKMRFPAAPDNYDDLLTQNRGLAAPGGMQGLLQPPKTYNQGWQKTSAAEAESIYNRYKPKGAPTSFGWKGAFDRG